jgi:hypothetical protein
MVSHLANLIQSAFYLLVALFSLVFVFIKGSRAIGVCCLLGWFLAFAHSINLYPLRTHPAATGIVGIVFLVIGTVMASQQSSPIVLYFRKLRKR